MKVEKLVCVDLRTCGKIIAWLEVIAAVILLITVGLIFACKCQWIWIDWKICFFFQNHIEANQFSLVSFLFSVLVAKIIVAACLFYGVYQVNFIPQYLNVKYQKNDKTDYTAM